MFVFVGIVVMIRDIVFGFKDVSNGFFEGGVWDDVFGEIGF